MELFLPRYEGETKKKHCPSLSLRDCVYLLDAMAMAASDRDGDAGSGQNTQRGLMAGRFDLDGRGKEGKWGTHVHQWDREVTLGLGRDCIQLVS